MLNMMFSFPSFLFFPFLYLVYYFLSFPFLFLCYVLFLFCKVGSFVRMRIDSAGWLLDS